MVVEGVEFADARDEGVVSEGCDAAIDIGPVDGFDVGLHGADFVRGVCEALHVNVGTKASLFLLVWW